MIPSSFQNAIFEAVKDDSFGNMIISAVAGSGKTTTIVKALSLIPYLEMLIDLQGFHDSDLQYEDGNFSISSERIVAELRETWNIK